VDGQEFDLKSRKAYFCGARGVPDVLAKAARHEPRASSPGVSDVSAVGRESGCIRQGDHATHRFGRVSSGFGIEQGGATAWRHSVASAWARRHVEDMRSQPTALERAFALARTGEYAGVSELRAQLKTEGYSTNQLEGPTLLRQLRALCTTSRGANADCR
jgi:hypothetical protein